MENLFWAAVGGLIGLIIQHAYYRKQIRDGEIERKSLTDSLEKIQTKNTSLHEKIDAQASAIQQQQVTLEALAKGQLRLIESVSEMTNPPPSPEAATQREAAAEELSQLMETSRRVATESDAENIRQAAEKLRAKSEQYSSALGLIGVIAQFGANIRKNFDQAQWNSRQAEARTNLRAIHTGMCAFRSERDRFPSGFNEINFNPMPTSSYIYFLSDNQVVGGGNFPQGNGIVAAARDLLNKRGISPHVDAASYTAVAVGNPKSDGQFDVWVINQNGELKNAG
ncbi:hypothetical protein ACLEPN_10445 [Myxococcus sp. 1LA]